tara:strand:+ start:3309 stop:6734 length:3426 start_codon:yes stop_codon:yes gene_type:complete
MKNKKAFKLNGAIKGLNMSADARDLEPNEAAFLDDMSLSKKGKITTRPDTYATDNTTIKKSTTSSSGDGNIYIDQIWETGTHVTDEMDLVINGDWSFCGKGLYKFGDRIMGTAHADKKIDQPLYGNIAIGGNVSTNNANTVLDGPNVKVESSSIAAENEFVLLRTMDSMVHGGVLNTLWVAPMKGGAIDESGKSQHTHSPAGTSIGSGGIHSSIPLGSGAVRPVRTLSLMGMTWNSGEWRNSTTVIHHAYASGNSDNNNTTAQYNFGLTYGHTSHGGAQTGHGVNYAYFLTETVALGATPAGVSAAGTSNTEDPDAIYTYNPINSDGNTTLGGAKQLFTEADVYSNNDKQWDLSNVKALHFRRNGSVGASGLTIYWNLKYNFQSTYAPDMTGLDIILDMEIDSDFDFTSMVVFQDSDADNIWFSYNSTESRYWLISREECIDLGILGGRNRIRIPWDAYSTQTTGYNSGSVRGIALAFIGSSGTNTGCNMMKLYEFSFNASEGVSSWRGDKYIFSSTKVHGKEAIESMPNMLTGGSVTDGVVDGSSFDALKLQVRKPADGTMHKLYWQRADLFGSGSGARYLLAISANNFDDGSGTNKTGVLKPSGEWDGQGNGDASFTEKQDDLSGNADVAILQYQERPSVSTWTFETGYPINTKNVIYAWKTAAVVGRQVYIGNCAKLHTNANLTTSADVTDPNSDAAGTKLGEVISWRTSGYTGTSDVSYTLKITGGTAGSGFTYQVKKNSDDYGDTVTSENATNITEPSSGWRDIGEGIQVAIAGDYGASSSGHNATPTYSVTDLNNAESKISITFEKDLILKGQPGNKAGFADAAYIDLELGSDQINVMRAVGDRLFVFTTDKLQILHVAQDSEFIEAQFEGYGILAPRQVTKVREGCAFVNSTGVYYFNGTTILPISENKIDQQIFTDKDAILYDPAADELLVVCDAETGDDGSTTEASTGNQNFYKYSLKTNAWVGKWKDQTLAITSNSAISNGVNNDYLTAYFQAGSNLNRWQHWAHSYKTDILSCTAEYRSPRLDFGDPGMLKEIKKIYVNANLSAFTAPDGVTTVTPVMTNQVYISINGGADIALTGTATNSTGLFEFDVPSDTANRRAVRDLQVYVKITQAAQTTEVGEIIIIYRELRVK